MMTVKSDDVVQALKWAAMRTARLAQHVEADTVDVQEVNVEITAIKEFLNQALDHLRR